MIVTMKKITLISLKSCEDELLTAIQKTGAVEIIPPAGDDEYEQDAELFSEIERELKRLEEARKVLKPYYKKPGFFESEPNLSAEEINKAKQGSYYVCNSIEQLNKTLLQKRSESVKIELLISQLTDWERLDTEIEKINISKRTQTVLGYVPAKNTAFLGELPCAAEVLKSDKKGECPCVVIYHKEQADEIKEKLSELGFVEYSLPLGFKGTVSENIIRLESELRFLNKEIDELVAKLKELTGDYVTLLAAEDAVNTEYAKLKAMSDILMSKSAFMLNGWVAESDVDSVRTAVDAVTDAYYFEIADPDEDDDVPVVTQNISVVKPFENMVNLYSLPSYKGIDATPFTTPFYILFFAIMLADVGYGLLFFIGCTLIEKIKKPREGSGFKSLVQMFKLCGIATAVCGFLFGGIFGFDIDNIFHTNNVFPLFIDPKENIMTMLYLSCGFGIFQMLFGIGIKMYMCIRSGDMQAAVYDNLSWIFLVTGILGAALLKAPFNAPFLIFAGVGAMLILVFGGRNKKGIMKIFGGFASLYGITNWISDIASYTRIAVLSLVGIMMAEVFNLIGGLLLSVGNGFLHIVCVILGVAIMIALHAYGLFINTLGAYAHTARLQYVEFFGKFYEPSGRAFKPLKIVDKNIRVKQ